MFGFYSFITMQNRKKSVEASNHFTTFCASAVPSVICRPKSCPFCFILRNKKTHRAMAMLTFYRFV